MDLSFKDSVRIGTTQRVLNVKIELQMINNHIVLNRQVSEFGPTGTIPRINSRTINPLCGRSFEDGSRCLTAFDNHIKVTATRIIQDRLILY